MEDASEHDDSFVQATALPASGQVAGRVCPGDPDFYEIVVPDGQMLAATAKPDPGTDLRVDLYAGPSSNDVVASGSSSGAGQPETTNHKNSSGKTLKIYVRVVGDDGAYSLTTTLG